MQAFCTHLAVEMDCDKLVGVNSTYQEDTTVNDLIAEVLGDTEVIESSYTIHDQFNTWMSKVLDNINTETANVNSRINESLSQQLQQGVITQYEYADLEYITRLWMKYKNSFNLYRLGCTGSKKEIILVLLELFELKQISKDIFVNEVLQL